MEYIAFHERNDKESNSPFALRGVTKKIICIVRTITQKKMMEHILWDKKLKEWNN